jgi:hypothetical protein
MTACETFNGPDDHSSAKLRPRTTEGTRQCHTLTNAGDILGSHSLSGEDGFNVRA